MTASFAILFRVGVHAGYLDRAIAGIVRSAGQRPLQLRRACLTLIVSLRGRMLHDGLALAGMRQTGDQDQCDDVHASSLTSSLPLLSLDEHQGRMQASFRHGTPPAA